MTTDRLQRIIMRMYSKFQVGYHKVPNELRIPERHRVVFEDLCDRRHFYGLDVSFDSTNKQYMGMHIFHTLQSFCVDWTEETNAIAK